MDFAPQLGFLINRDVWGKGERETNKAYHDKLHISSFLGIPKKKLEEKRKVVTVSIHSACAMHICTGWEAKTDCGLPLIGNPLIAKSVCAVSLKV